MYVSMLYCYMLLAAKLYTRLTTAAKTGWKGKRISWNLTLRSLCPVLKSFTRQIVTLNSESSETRFQSVRWLPGPNSWRTCFLLFPAVEFNGSRLLFLHIGNYASCVRYVLPNHSNLIGGQCPLLILITAKIDTNTTADKLYSSKIYKRGVAVYIKNLTCIWSELMLRITNPLLIVHSPVHLYLYMTTTKRRTPWTTAPGLLANHDLHTTCEATKSCGFLAN